MMRGELEAFIEEDVGFCDLSSVTVPDIDVDAKIIAKEEGILAGLAEAREIFSYFELKTSSESSDGSKIEDGTTIINVSGSSRSILTAERLAINFLGRMSGIATLTGKLVKRSSGNAVIAGTRKTTPGFRRYEKKAIVLGGGDPHRFNLSDAVMIKDNHIKVAGLKGAIEASKGAGFTKKIEVEVESLEDALIAAGLGVHIIMLDNMTPEAIEETIRSLSDAGLRDRILLEASGGITIENVGRYADTGVDVISVGSLTTAARWLDFGLYIE
ncbi:MAG: nicotinate-nucleotide pyrophosphorylase [Candidatus Methanolliviera sp. GoM_oil]|nr:MAG: nicotinate-nucleotide pyrophosphorylase [Candidatus Methanolliviera sp. GoM_oil]